MKTALFTNFTEKEFIGYWDGKAKKFAPGASLYMPDYLARHFAKHLTNQELLKPKLDEKGDMLRRIDPEQNNRNVPVLFYEGGDKMTSPKFPEQVPLFMELFNRAYQPDDSDEYGEKKDDLDTIIDVTNKNRQERVAAKSTAPEKQDPTQPQVILPPDFEEDEDEASFKGTPVETK